MEQIAAVAGKYAGTILWVYIGIVLDRKGLYSFSFIIKFRSKAIGRKGMAIEGENIEIR